MASGQVKLTPQDLMTEGEKELPGAPIVHVEGIEQETPESPRRNSKEDSSQIEAHNEKPAVTHETETLKTTVTEEEDQQPSKASMTDKVKGAVEQMGDKLRPESAVHAKQEDPHPAIN